MPEDAMQQDYSRKVKTQWRRTGTAVQQAPIQRVMKEVLSTPALLNARNPGIAHLMVLSLAEKYR